MLLGDCCTAFTHLQAHSGHGIQLTGLDVAVVPADKGVVGVAPGSMFVTVRVAAVAILRVDAKHGGVWGLASAVRQTSMDIVPISDMLHCTCVRSDKSVPTKNRLMFI